MQLKKVLQGIVKVTDDAEVKGISTDSRQDLSGKLFIAYKGVDTDGHKYINQAIEKGAVAVVGEQDLLLQVPYFKVGNGRQAWAKAYANWYDNPQDKLIKIGVTGTDGKTTTSTLIFQILKANGFKVALLSTVAAYIGQESIDTGFHVTSPDPDDFFKLLQLMVDKGITHAVLEVTSHALDQYRYGDFTFEVGVLTNITHEHLDYHKNFENYLSAKAKLFTRSKIAILNKDDPSFEFLKERSLDQVIAYTKAQVKKVSPSLAGDYNLYNIGAALEVATVFQIPTKISLKEISEFAGILGRREEIRLGQEFRVVVDFAHTPNALLQILTQLKQELPKEKKLILVFGCAGLRDVTKRPMMGEIAKKLADVVIITAEDPRTEDLEQIFQQITQGQTGFVREDDRQQAINRAILQAVSGDIVVITGKGHEKSMNLGLGEVPWSDQEAVRKALGKE